MLLFHDNHGQASRLYCNLKFPLISSLCFFSIMARGGYKSYAKKGTDSSKWKKEEMSGFKEKSGNKGMSGKCGKVKEEEEPCMKSGAVSGCIFTALDWTKVFKKKKAVKVTAPLDQLPGETLEKIFLQLDPACAVNLGLCSTRQVLLI